MKRASFSMIELVFVIVIVGALGAVAVNKLATSRMDAQVSMYRSDIATVLRQVSARVFAEDVQTANNAIPPKSYKTWGDWLMDTPHLEPIRWKPYDMGINAVINYHEAQDGFKQQVCEGKYMYIDNVNGLIIFDPKEIKQDKNAPTVCKMLADSYGTKNTVKIQLQRNEGVKVF